MVVRYPRPRAEATGIAFIRNEAPNKKEASFEGSGSGVVRGTKHRKRRSPLAGPWKAVEHLARTRRPGFSLATPGDRL